LTLEARIIILFDMIEKLWRQAVANMPYLNQIVAAHAARR
jgi:hypothetical protein